MFWTPRVGAHVVCKNELRHTKIRIALCTNTQKPLAHLMVSSLSCLAHRIVSHPRPWHHLHHLYHLLESMASCYRGRKRQKQSDSITCVGCSSNLDESSYAQIKKSTCAVDDCEHILCFGCFGRAQGESSANIKLTCPSESCSRLSGEWSIVEFKSGEHHNLLRTKGRPAHQRRRYETTSRPLLLINGAYIL